MLPYDVWYALSPGCPPDADRAYLRALEMLLLSKHGPRQETERSHLGTAEILRASVAVVMLESSPLHSDQRLSVLRNRGPMLSLVWRPIRELRAALNRFAIMFEDRVPLL